MDLLNLIDLNEVERQSYEQLYENYKSKQLEVKDVRETITKMKNAVTYELVKTPITETEKIIKLQARIENLIGLEVIFETPEIAEKQFQTALHNLRKNTERKNV